MADGSALKRMLVRWTGSPNGSRGTRRVLSTAERSARGTVRSQSPQDDYGCFRHVVIIDTWYRYGCRRLHTMLRIVLLFAGAALLGALLWRLGPSEVLDALGRIRWYFLPVLGLGGAHQMVRALALRACVLRAGVLRYRDALAIRLSGEAIQSLTFTGPMLAEPTKAWLLTRRGLTLREGFAATITEYLIYTLVTAAMSMTGLLYLVVRFGLSGALRTIAIATLGVCAAFLVASAIAI